MKIERVHSGQNFGMAIKIFDPQSAVALKSALKTNGDIIKFAEMIRAQKNNEFNIGLRYIYEIDRKKLRGCIYDGRSFYREFRESDFSADFLSPINFIKKMCKEADKAAKERQAKIISGKTLDFSV